MIIRGLTEEDVKEHDRVSSQAFVYSCDLTESSALPSPVMAGAFLDDNKTLAADMEIGDRRCFFGNGTLRCAAVGGVAAKPEYRGRGAVRAMFDALFDGSVFGDRWDVSVLYPFSSFCYGKFGYGCVGSAVTLTVPFGELSDVPKNTDVRLHEGDDHSALFDIYNACAENYSLCFVRDAASLQSSPLPYIAEPYLEKKYTYIRGKEAYATFSVNREKSCIEVKEIFYRDRNALVGIVGFLRNFEGNQRTVVFENIPARSEIFTLIRDVCRAEMKARPVGMARVLNAENVLKTKKYPRHGGSFVLGLRDVIEKNDRAFAVEYAGGTAEVHPTDRPPELILEPPAAAKLFFDGVTSFRELAFLPGAEIKLENPELLAAFPVENTFFCDPF